jgi:hypothetical protein
LEPLKKPGITIKLNTIDLEKKDSTDIKGILKSSVIKSSEDSESNQAMDKKFLGT